MIIEEKFKTDLITITLNSLGLVSVDYIVEPFSRLYHVIATYEKDGGQCVLYDKTGRDRSRLLTHCTDVCKDFLRSTIRDIETIK